MTVTVVLTGMGENVNLVDMARMIRDVFDSDQIDSFCCRHLPRHPRTGVPQIALDFNSKYDAMIAHHLLDGYKYEMADGAESNECTLRAIIMHDLVIRTTEESQVSHGWVQRQSQWSPRPSDLGLVGPHETLNNDEAWERYGKDSVSDVEQKRAKLQSRESKTPRPGRRRWDTSLQGISPHYSSHETPRYTPREGSPRGSPPTDKGYESLYARSSTPVRSRWNSDCEFSMEEFIESQSCSTARIKTNGRRSLGFVEKGQNNDYPSWLFKYIDHLRGTADEILGDKNSEKKEDLSEEEVVKNENGKNTGAIKKKKPNDGSKRKFYL